jgi:formiminotetrahydrofolate cyclodeaminase
MTEVEESLNVWLVRMATQSLPGGVAAAALTAAMGAALSAKSARLTLVQQSLTDSERGMLESTVDLAQARQDALVRLTIADEQAYRAVLDTKGRSAEAWQMATETPIRVAEACASLLDRLPALSNACRRSVRVDLQIGSWLLETGMRSGLQAAESNLRVWEAGAESQALRVRIAALQESESD